MADNPNLGAFGKLFESIYSGSMIGAGEHVFAVWPYCVAHAKPPGIVEINPVLLAAIIGTEVKKVQDALDYLCSPDPNSRSKLEDGKRLVRVGQFLYRMVNWDTYRNERAKQERAEYKRQWDRDHAATRHHRSRNRKSEKSIINPTQSAPNRFNPIESEEQNKKSDFSSCQKTRQNPSNPSQAEAEAEAEVLPPPVPPPPSKSEGGGFSESDREKFAGLLGALYNDSTPYTTWGYQRQHNFAALLRRPKLGAEIEQLRRFKPRYEFFPHSLDTLMEKWDRILNAANNPDIGQKSKITQKRELTGLEEAKIAAGLMKDPNYE